MADNNYRVVHRGEHTHIEDEYFADWDRVAEYTVYLDKIGVKYSVQEKQGNYWIEIYNNEGESMARELNREISCIATVKCPDCNEMIDAYAYNEHFCAGKSVGDGEQCKIIG
jgi:hypothetical protein